MRNLINRWNFLQSWSNFQNVTIFYRMLVHVVPVYSALKHSHQVHQTLVQRSIVDGGWVNKYERAPLAASFKCSGNVHKLQSVKCVMFRQNSTRLTQQLPFRGPTCSAPPTPGTACPRFRASAPWKEVASTNSRKRRSFHQMMKTTRLCLPKKI